MFDKYLIDAASVRNTGPQDAPTGFAFESKLGYYRGLGLSMIEELTVSIDGETCRMAPPLDYRIRKGALRVIAPS